MARDADGRLRPARRGSSTRIANRDSTAFLDELVELERSNPNLRLVLTMTEEPAWEGETRRLDADLRRDHLGDDLHSSRYLVAGPPQMVEATVETLGGAGVPEDEVVADSFSGY